MLGEVFTVVLEDEDEGELLVLLESASCGRVALILTSVCLKDALLASMRETGSGVVVAVVVAVVVEVVTTVVVVVEACTSSESEMLSSCSSVMEEREVLPDWSMFSSWRMSCSQSKLSSELSSASCLIVGGTVAAGRVSVAVECFGEVKRPLVSKRTGSILILLPSSVLPPSLSSISLSTPALWGM